MASKGHPNIVPEPGANQEQFYSKDIGRGDECITEKPDVGDYGDDDVSRPDGQLFAGPQAWSSDKLHGSDEEAEQ